MEQISTNNSCHECLNHPLGLCQPCFSKEANWDRYEARDEIEKMFERTFKKLDQRGNHEPLIKFKEFKRICPNPKPSQLVSKLSPWIL